MERNLRLVFDIETGGLDPNIHGVTEIGAVVVDYGHNWEQCRIMTSYHELVKPQDRWQYTQEALDLQGRTLDDLKGGISFRQAVEGLRGIVETWWGDARSCNPVAHNAKFDSDFILNNCGAEKIRWPFSGFYRCSVQLFRLLQDLGLHDCPKANLDTIVEHYGISLPEDKRHTAIEDVLATAKAYQLMMQKLYFWGRVPELVIG